MCNSGIVQVMRIRNYRLFAVGQAVSNTGSWMQRIAQDWLVLQLTGNSGLALGVTTVLQSLPVLLFGMWGGVVADRFPKRKVLIGAQVALSVPAGTLGVLTATGVAMPWHVYTMAFCLGMATVFDQPARQSFVVEMTGQDRLPAAVSVNSLIYNGARLIGPSLAGMAIAVFGLAVGFLLNALSYLVALAALALMRPAALDELPACAGKRRLRAGLAHVSARVDLLLPVVIMGITSAFGQSMQVVLPLLAKQDFSSNAGGYGLLVTAMAAGAVTGALCFTDRVRRPRNAVLLSSAVTLGALEVLTAVAPSYWICFAVLVAAGTATLVTNISANAAVNLRVDPAMRGRAMALFIVVLLTSNSLGALLLGAIAESFSPTTALVFGGVTVIVASPTAAVLLLGRAGIPLRTLGRAEQH
ncbi:MAG: MFS transporter [Pseudonocardiaceae bacterium]